MTTIVQDLIDSNPIIKALDARTGLVRPALDVAVTAFQEAITDQVKTLKSQPFFYVTPANHLNRQLSWLLETSTGLLWWGVSKDEEFSKNYSVLTGQERLKQIPSIARQSWQVPTGDTLWAFASMAGNPWTGGGNRCLWQQNAWLISNSNNGIDLNDGRYDRSSCFLIGCNTAFANNLPELIRHARQNGWIITPTRQPAKIPSNMVSGLPDVKERLNDLRSIFKSLDHHSARLPMLEDADFTDPNKGLWEFWGLDAAELNKLGLRARNPADDVQQGMVAIDFGTSSTVVAYEEHGVGKLLRIGVTNFWEKEKSAHYENPTVLEFVDLKAFF